MLYGFICLFYEYVRVMVDFSSDWDGCYVFFCVVIVGSFVSWCGWSWLIIECGLSFFKENGGECIVC